MIEQSLIVKVGEKWIERPFEDAFDIEEELTLSHPLMSYFSTSLIHLDQNQIYDYISPSNFNSYVDIQYKSDLSYISF